MHVPFDAVAKLNKSGDVSHTVRVVHSAMLTGEQFMVVCELKTSVYVSKDQVMKFFGLVDAPTPITQVV